MNSASSIDDTMLFNDDFSGSSIDISKWDGKVSNAAVSGGVLSYGGDNTQDKLLSIPHFRSNISICAKIKYLTPASYIGDVGLFSVSTGGYVDTRVTYTPFNAIRAGNGVSYISKNSNIPLGTWFTLNIDILNGSNASFYKDGVPLTSSPITSSVPDTTDLEVGFVGRATSTVVQSDWLYVRAHTANKPTWAADGEEQYRVLNPDINTTLSTPINSTYTQFNNLSFTVSGNFTSANASIFIDSINKWNGSITTGQNTAYNITLTEGLHSWYINATATASGNTTSNISATENFYYDISNPTVTTANINPSYSIISEGSIVKTNLSWSDNLQLKNASFFVNTGSGYSETDNTTLSGTSDWFNTSIDTAGLTGHSVSWYQIAYDQAGNSYNYSGSFDVVLGALSIYVFDETTGDPVLPSDVKVYNDDVSRTATINGSTNISTISYDGFTSGKYIVSVIADDYYTRRSIILIDVETLSSLNIYLPSTNETTIFDQFVLVDNTLMYELSECIIRLDKPLPNGTDTVYSSYFDFDGVASTYLIATDQYILYIETPDSVISYGWLTPDADGLINIVITDPITDLLDDWLSYAIVKSDTGSISLNYESDIDIDTASFYLNTSAGDVLYTASISTDSGSFTYSADINESYYLSFTATSQSGETKTVTRFIFWNEGGIQPERLPLLPDGAPDWFYNLLSVGVIIICILLFSQVRADASCVIAAAFSGLFWYWGWLKISGIVIAVIALIAIAAVMYKSKREGI